MEFFNNLSKGGRVATVNYSVPDDVKAAFDAAFGQENKSAVIAELMRRAVRERDLVARRRTLFEQLTARRDVRPKASTKALLASRTSGRP